MAQAALAENFFSAGKHCTYAEYKEWPSPNGERYEVIYGVPYAMAAPNTYHQGILTELLKQIAVYLTGKTCKVFPAPFDVRLFYQDDEMDDTVVQPDITIVCDKNKRGKEGCRGAPDFAAEIWSPSNDDEEKKRKFALYRDAGVREFWELDPKSQTVVAHSFESSTPLSRIYHAHEMAQMAIFPDLTIDLAAVFTE